MLFQVTVDVDLDLGEPLTVQERARLEAEYGPELLTQLEDPDEPITATQTRAVIWTKLQTQFPTIGVDQFDSVAGLEAAVG